MRDVKLLEFPKICDHRGNLSFIEQGRHVDFDIKRVFYVYDIPSGVGRGAHAHRSLYQAIICLSGGLEVSLDDGHETRKVKLNRPWKALQIPPMIWASEGDFDPNTVYIVLASDYYDETDYIRDYDDFLSEVARRETR